MKWSETTRLSASVQQRGFCFDANHETVPGLLWLPAEPSPPLSLVLCGHAGFSHKASEGMLELAGLLTESGRLAVVAIDAPLHGDRRPKDLEDPWKAWLRYWRRTGAQDLASEWLRAAREIQALPEVGEGPVGYWGLSLATQYGLALLASEPRIRAAVLGLFGLHGDDRLAAYAARTRCSVFFAQQQGDEFHNIAQTSALFDELGSDSKTIRSSAGSHFSVPDEVRTEAVEFLVERL